MKIVRGINFIEGSREEELPNFESNFPYIASRVELNQYAEDSIPWHWHKSVEVFYVEQGKIEYRTPNGHYIFPQGSGGMVNSNVLHTTKPQEDNTVQLIHIFDPSFIGGETGNIIVKKYIMPIITSGELDMN
ncbi:cupin domain-containing protein [Mediterraneibacter faecis]|uniref:cupin domain-containing protein n=1 Tax=Mediterraneibacter faecis TaxID=592978 RepID=UPI00299F76B5|nr:AraC family ligand binding domain-containing protein [Mediterraneibacter faecis]